MKPTLLSSKQPEQNLSKSSKNTRYPATDGSPPRNLAASQVPAAQRGQVSSNARATCHSQQPKDIPIPVHDESSENLGASGVAFESESNDTENNRTNNQMFIEDDGERDQEEDDQSQEEDEEYDEEDMGEIVDQEELEKYVKNFQEEIEIKFNASEVNGTYKMPRDFEDSEGSSNDSSLVLLKEVTAYDLEEQNYARKEKMRELALKKRELEKQKQSPQRNQRAFPLLPKNFIDEQGNIHIPNEQLKNDELSVLTALNILENVENVAFESVSAKLKDKSSPLYHVLYRIVEENMKKSKTKAEDVPDQLKSPGRATKKQTKEAKQVASSQPKKEPGAGIKGAMKLEIKKLKPENDRTSISSQHQRRPNSKNHESRGQKQARNDDQWSREVTHNRLRPSQHPSNINNNSSQHNSREVKGAKAIGNSNIYHFPASNPNESSLSQRKKHPGKGVMNISCQKTNFHDNSGDKKITGGFGAPLYYAAKPGTPSGKQALRRITEQNPKITKGKTPNFQEEAHVASKTAMKHLKTPSGPSAKNQNFLEASQHINNLLKTVQENSSKEKGANGMKTRREKMISSNAIDAPSGSPNFKSKEGFKAMRPYQHQINTTKQNESNSSMPKHFGEEKSGIMKIGSTSQSNPLRVIEGNGQTSGAILLGGSSASSLRSNDSSGNSSLDKVPKKTSQVGGILGNGNYPKLNSHLLSKLKNTANFGKTVKQNMRNSTKTTATPSTGNPSFNHNQATNFQKNLQSHMHPKEGIHQSKATQRKIGEEEISRQPHPAPSSKLMKGNDVVKSIETFKFSPDYDKGGRSPTGPSLVKQLFQSTEYHHK